MIATPLLLAGLLVGVVAAIVLLDKVIRDFGITTTLVLVLAAIVALSGTKPGVTLAGFHVTVGDAILALVVTAIIARVLRGTRFPRATGLVFVLAGLVLFSLLRGVGDFGLATAVNESRGSLTFYAVTIYFATIRPTEHTRRRIAKLWMVYAGFLVLLAVQRWLAVFGPLPAGGHWYSPENFGGMRVLWSDDAFVLAQAFLIMLPGLLRHQLSRMERLASWAILATVILTQHRSVWAALLVGVAVVLLLEGNLGRKWARRLVLGVGVTAVLLLTLLSGPLLEQAVTSSDATRTGTFEWRVEGWTSLYRDAGPESPLEVALGRPYGASWERELRSLGYSTDVRPHNFYIEQNLRVGLVGVVVLVAVHVVVLRRLRRTARRRPQQIPLSDRTLMVLLATQLVYYIPYWPAPEQAVLLGLAIAATRVRVRRAPQSITEPEREAVDDAPSRDQPVTPGAIARLAIQNRARSAVATRPWAPIPYGDAATQPLPAFDYGPARDADGTAAAEPSPSSGLASRSLHGVKWTYSATMLSAILQVVFAAIMGRLLFPEVFGLIAMTQLVLNFAEYFARMGVGPALIQKLEITDDDARAGFTSSVVLGALSSAVIWVAAPLVARVFDEPDVVRVLQIMGLSLLVSALGQTAKSLLQRALRFRETALIEMVSYVVGYFTVGLVLAAMGAGVWSLVGAAITQRGLQSSLYYIRARHPVTPTFDLAVYRPLYAFGSRISVISLMEYVGISLDTFMVGRYAGAAPLGQYNRGNTLIQVPLYRLTDALGQVLFPTFSRLQNDIPRARRAYLGAVGLAGGVLLPFCAGIAVSANEIVLVILGDQWTPVITILPILSVYGSLLVLTHFAGLMAEATNELNKKIVLQAGYLLTLVVLLVPAIGRDLWAYAAAFAVGNVVRHGAHMWLMNRIIGVTLSDYARIYSRAFVAALGTGAAIFVVRQAMLALGAPLFLVLLLEIAVGAVMLLLNFRFGPLRPLAMDVVRRLDDDGGALTKVAQMMVGDTGADRDAPARDAR